MAELCLRVLDSLGMPIEWSRSVVVPVVKWNCKFINCGYRGDLKLFQQNMNVVGSMLE